MNLSELGGRFVGNGLGGEKIGDEARGVGIQNLRNTLGLRRFEDESGVVIFRDAVDDLRVIVRGSVRAFLTGQRKDYARIVAACGGKLVRLLPCSDFQVRPFTPEIDVGGRFNDVGNVRAPDACGDFDEIELAVGVRFQELGVRHSAKIAEAFDYAAIYFEQVFGFGSIALQRAGGEDAALMRDVQRRRTVDVGLGEEYFTLGNYAVHVVDRAGNELLEEIKRLLIAELIEPGPEVVGFVDFLHADAGGLRSGLEQPGRGNAGHEFTNSVVVENGNEFGNEDAGFLRARTHGQFVSEIADGGETHAGDAEVLAESGDILHVKFVEGDDAIDGLRPVHVADGVDQVVLSNIFRHEEQLVERFARPVAVDEFD